MIRRILLVTACLGVLAGAASTAAASEGDDGRHGVCIGMTSDPSQPNRDAFCVDLFPYAQDALPK